MKKLTLIFFIFCFSFSFSTSKTTNKKDVDPYVGWYYITDDLVGLDHISVIEKISENKYKFYQYWQISFGLKISKNPTICNAVKKDISKKEAKEEMENYDDPYRFNLKKLNNNEIKITKINLQNSKRVKCATN